MQKNLKGGFSKILIEKIPRTVKKVKSYCSLQSSAVLPSRRHHDAFSFVAPFSCHFSWHRVFFPLFFPWWEKLNNWNYYFSTQDLSCRCDWLIKIFMPISTQLVAVCWWTRDRDSLTPGNVLYRPCGRKYDQFFCRKSCRFHSLLEKLSFRSVSDNSSYFLVWRWIYKSLKSTLFCPKKLVMKSSWIWILKKQLFKYLPIWNPHEKTKTAYAQGLP